MAVSFYFLVYGTVMKACERLPFFQFKVLERNNFPVKMVYKRLRVGPRGVASPFIKPCRVHPPGFKEDITSISLWIWVLTGL